jgi:hypothetical protein
MNYFSSPFLVGFVAFLITVISLARSIGQKNSSKITRRWALLLFVPGLITMGIFYSFAARMHSSLNGWPDFCDCEQLPPTLLLHSDIMYWAFGINLLMALCIPIALILFYAVPRLRPHMVYPAFLGSASWLCFFATFFAPAGFLNWFWD